MVVTVKRLLENLKIIVCLAVTLTAMSCSRTPRSACQQDLDSYPAQVRCHDEAYYSLKAQPEQSVVTMVTLCETHKLGRACSNAAHAYENPGFAGLSANYTLSAEYYRKGCDLGDGVACNNLANQYISGRGVELSEHAGADLLERACGLDYGKSCFRIAIITQRGILRPDNPAKVAELMRKGCDLDDTASCHDLGYLYMDGKGVEKDVQTARDLFARTCEQGLPRGCGSLAWQLIQEGGEENSVKALDLLQTACAGDDAPSCNNLGYMFESGKGAAVDPARAARYYSKACQGGDLAGCGNLGILFAEGRGVPRDDTAALPLLERGCSDKASDSCRTLALFHREGRAGLPVSDATAGYFRSKACEYGDSASCAENDREQK
jgi:TPR repeat protein